ARRGAAAEIWCVRGSAGRQGQGDLPPAAPSGIERGKEPDRLLRLRRARRENRAGRRRQLRGDLRRQEDVRLEEAEVRRGRREGETELRQADEPRRHRGAGGSAR